MPSWLVKATVQKTIGVLPGGHRLNALFQRHVTRSLRLDRAMLVDHLACDAAHAAAVGDRRDFTAVEVGTGWHPIWPVAMFLSGAARIVTGDRARLLTYGRTLETLDAILALADDALLAAALPDASSERVDALRRLRADPPRSLTPLLTALNVEYRVGGDLLASVDDGSVDLASTNGVLQYLDPPHLDALLARLADLIGARGATVHDVDLRDQFAIRDPSIGKLNFLRYSEREWRTIRSAILPNSRLRLEGYHAAFAAAGLAVDTRVLEALDAAEIARTPLHADFAACDRDGMRAGVVRFVARRAVLH